ncbi:hypothetical protein PO909_007106 [Leuciscus waleckii]
MQKAASCPMRYRLVQQMGSSVGAGEERRHRPTTPTMSPEETRSNSSTTTSPSSAGSFTCVCAATHAWWLPEPRWSGRNLAACTPSL